jgi:predicted XRE-type DNA-binding protein
MSRFQDIELSKHLTRSQGHKLLRKILNLLRIPRSPVSHLQDLKVFKVSSFNIC